MKLHVEGISEPDATRPDFVEVGRYTYYDQDNIRFVGYVPGERIVIGKYCSIAYGTTILVGGQHTSATVATFPFDNILLDRSNPTRSYRRTADTVIGSDVWLGYQSFVLGGARIGHGAIVGARSVVAGDVEPYAIMAGNPARLIRHRFEPEIIAGLLRIAWWDWPDEQVRANVEWFYRPVQEFVEHFQG